MNKKSVVTGSKIMIGVLLASLFIVVLGGSYVSMSRTYGNPVSDKYSSMEGHINQVVNTSTVLAEIYKGGSVTSGSTVALAANSLYSGFQILLNSISIPLEMIREIWVGIPFIPRVFLGFLLALLVIATVYIIGSAFGRWNI